MESRPLRPILNELSLDEWISGDFSPVPAGSLLRSAERPHRSYHRHPRAGVAELADAADSKSDAHGHKALQSRALTGTRDGVIATGAATGGEALPADARLQSLIDAWPDLPEAVRAEIAAMVGASRSR